MDNEATEKNELDLHLLTQEFLQLSGKKSKRTLNVIQILQSERQASPPVNAV